MKQMQKKPEERKSSEIKNRTRNNIPIISLNEYGSVNYSYEGTDLDIKATDDVDALAKKYEADILNAKANIEVYVTNPAGIGEHPDLAAAIDSQVDIIAHAEDKLGVLNKHYNSEQDKEMLVETPDAQMLLNL